MYEKSQIIMGIYMKLKINENKMSAQNEIVIWIR